MFINGVLIKTCLFFSTHVDEVALDVFDQNTESWTEVYRNTNGVLNDGMTFGGVATYPNGTKRVLALGTNAATRVSSFDPDTFARSNLLVRILTQLVINFLTGTDKIK